MKLNQKRMKVSQRQIKEVKANSLPKIGRSLAIN